tara:strand:+ start:257 stop:1342 length:1086 start_codon:yes stop_codon:yes gene_type:complete
MVEAPTGTVQGSAGDPGSQEAQDRRRAFNPLSRNKRSITVNLKSEEGRAIVHDLAKDADVFLEGFRPGVTDRLGVGYQTIAEINPRIVYASLSGYGQTGPYVDMVGHDINYISVGGALAMIGREGQPLSIPQNVIADFAGGGLMTAFAITSALLSRQNTGQGQYLDMSMSDNVLYLLASQSGGVLGGGSSPVPGMPGLGGGSPHYNVYECADGKYISLGSLEPRFWENLCQISGREDLIEHEADTTKHSEFTEHLRTMFKNKDRDTWFQELKDIELCVAPVLNLEEALHDPHQQHRKMTVTVEDENLGSIEQIGIGPKFSETPGSVRSTAPHPGKHTDEVLAGLGYDSSRIASLRESGVVS